MIPFIDLHAQQKLIKDKIDRRINEVLKHGQYILGPEVKELEDRLCSFTGSKYVLCCSSGTDALLLSLLGLKIKPGEGVIVPAFSFASKARSLSTPSPHLPSNTTSLAHRLYVGPDLFRGMHQRTLCRYDLPEFPYLPGHLAHGTF